MYTEELTQLQPIEDLYDLYAQQQCEQQEYEYPEPPMEEEYE